MVNANNPNLARPPIHGKCPHDKLVPRFGAAGENAVIQVRCMRCGWLWGVKLDLIQRVSGPAPPPAPPKGPRIA